MSVSSTAPMPKHRPPIVIPLLSRASIMTCTGGEPAAPTPAVFTLVGIHDGGPAGPDFPEGGGEGPLLPQDPGHYEGTSVADGTPPPVSDINTSVDLHQQADAVTGQDDPCCHVQTGYA